ncbi:MAG: AAA family ATPase [Blastocatellia bacterium]|nr:AAA family ATPase [Blastocatellia bacterium]
MYKDFYGLKDMPFELTPDLGRIFQTASYLEVLATLKYGVEHNKGLVVLTGEAGTGKTTALRSAIRHFGREVQAVYIFNPFLTAAEFFEYLADEMGLGLKRGTSKPEILSTLGRYLSFRHSKGLRTVLILDEAHGLPTPLLEETRLLLNFETNSEKLFQVILCGQPELQDTLNRPDLRQLKQRISLRCRIKPLSIFEINNYIHFRLKAAGAVNATLFDSTAVSVIWHASQGIPRMVNNICDNALLYGYGEGCKVITRDIIEEVIESLDLSPSKLDSDASPGFGSEARSGM